MRVTSRQSATSRRRASKGVTKKGLCEESRFKKIVVPCLGLLKVVASAGSAPRHGWKREKDFQQEEATAVTTAASKTHSQNTLEESTVYRRW